MKKGWLEMGNMTITNIDDSKIDMTVRLLIDNPPTITQQAVYQHAQGLVGIWFSQPKQLPINPYHVHESRRR